MTARVTTAQLIERLPDLLARIHESGESFVIERDGRPVATLAPAPETAGITWREFAALYRTLPRPDEEFADDIEAIHSAQTPIDPPEWPS